MNHLQLICILISSTLKFGEREVDGITLTEPQEYMLQFWKHAGRGAA